MQNEKENPHFIFYSTFYETVQCLEENEQLKFLKALIEYGLYGTEPNFSRKDLAIFTQWKFALDTQKARQNINSKNRLGKTKNNENKIRFSSENEKNENAEIEIEKEIEREFENENINAESVASDSSESHILTEKNSSSISSNNSESEDSDNATTSKRKRFTPPTVEEVKAYCDERKNNVNAEAFIDFYASKNWYVGKNKMTDWHASVRNWERNGDKFAKSSSSYGRNEFRDSINANTSWIENYKEEK